MNTIDFSCKHHIMLEDEEGLCVPMDEPYFRALGIAPGTWRILSDGDYSYLLEGDDEALVIDSGYGAGNIREFCQTLTNKPVRSIANTHDHFDHTASNGYFDCAYMSAETKELATIPFPSFEGIDFPRDYPIVIVDDGDIISLAGRDIEVFKIPDHAVGSLVFLDRRERILFTGDEFMSMGKSLNGSVLRWAGYMEKLIAHSDAFDVMYGGGGELSVGLIKQHLEAAQYILAGNDGVTTQVHPFNNSVRADEQGRTVWKRRLPHPEDGPKNWGADIEYKRIMEYKGCRLTYDMRKITE